MEDAAPPAPARSGGDPYAIPTPCHRRPRLRSGGLEPAPPCTSRYEERAPTGSSTRGEEAAHQKSKWRRLWRRAVGEQGQGGAGFPCLLSWESIGGATGAASGALPGQRSAPDRARPQTTASFSTSIAAGAFDPDSLVTTCRSTRSISSTGLGGRAELWPSGRREHDGVGALVLASVSRCGRSLIGLPLSFPVRFARLAGFCGYLGGGFWALSGAAAMFCYFCFLVAIWRGELYVLLRFLYVC